MRIPTSIAMALTLALAACGGPRTPELGARLELGPGPGTAPDLQALLGGAADAGFARADRPRAFAFPADHGAHAGFRTEWWYVTGNLASASGRAFGYQLTFFRQALASSVPASTSSWRSAHVWMAHFAVTNGGGRGSASQDHAGGFRAFERFAREAAGLAGVSTEPFRVHLDDWEIASIGAGFAPLRLRAADGDGDPVALELELVPTRAPILQGEAGLSVKGPEPGNASYYYSLSRLATRGTLSVAGERHEVSGSSWLDREWSTSSLGEGVVGWDWLALHLDDGSDLMLYRLRRSDGSAAPESAATLVENDGTQRRITASELTLTPRGRWDSPRGGSYPAGWSVAIAALELELEIEPRIADQELALSVRYWEGAVRVRGQRAGTPLAGDGYLEMTGYAPIARTAALAPGR